MKPGAVAIVVVLWVGAAAAQTVPYAGQQDRGIASLSAQDVDDLLAGRGWGLAKPAELNGYPGPSHVLELADDLSLSADQRAEVAAIFQRMQDEAQLIGADYVAAERALDTAFARGDVTSDHLTDLTAAAGALRADLRAVHLAAHLETAPVLTRHQTMTYSALRGYGGDHAAGQARSDHDAAGHGAH